MNCPKKIIKIGDTINGKGYFVAEQFDEEKCTGCALCAVMCPDVAITVYK
jgi:2-oxoglutarate ferredoxin oxidoreductase subunit delta